MDIWKSYDHIGHMIWFSWDHIGRMKINCPYRTHELVFICPYWTTDAGAPTHRPMGTVARAYAGLVWAFGSSQGRKKGHPKGCPLTYSVFHQEPLDWVMHRRTTKGWPRLLYEVVLLLAGLTHSPISHVTGITYLLQHLLRLPTPPWHIFCQVTAQNILCMQGLLHTTVYVFNTYIVCWKN